MDHNTVKQVSGVAEHVAHLFFSLHSIVSLIVFLAIAFALGRLAAAVLRRLVTSIGRQADKTESLQMVNRLRRSETLLVLSIALIRTFLVLFALYLWWLYIHPNQQPTAIIGASAVLAITLSAVLSPALRDIASGSVMMAEQWYAVGDYVKSNHSVICKASWSGLRCALPGCADSTAKSSG